VAQFANPINHLIVLCMENRSFDHFLGSLSIEAPPRTDIDGLRSLPYTVPNPAGGAAIAGWRMDPPGHRIDPNIPDTPHGWDDAHADWHNGTNDGFVQTFANAHPGITDVRIPMGYYTRDTLSALYTLADNFVVCDRWHCSLLSSTWPNRKFLHSGRIDDDRDTQIVPGINGFQTAPIYDVIAAQRTPETLNWRCYFSDIPFLGFWYDFAFRNLRNFETIDAFVRDCLSQTLPTISVIDPPFSLADDHPPHDPLVGEKFIALVVDALTNSPSWHDSALLLLYDENGGFYDHVIPPPALEASPPDATLGFRVPALIISPYAKKRYASHVIYDHTSFIASIAARWTIDFDASIYGGRWKTAQPIWNDAFDFSAAPREGGIFTGDPITGVTWGTNVRERLQSPLGAFEAALERIFVLPELKTLDRRADVFDTLGTFEQSVITLKRSAGYARA